MTMPIDLRRELESIFGLIRARRMDEAEARCRAALDANADNINLLALLGAILLQKSEWGEAEQTLLRVVELEPAFAKPQEDLGALYMAINDPDKAIGHFESALALDPGLTTARRGLAAALYRVGRESEAEAVRRELPDDSPSGRLLARARELRSGGENDKAEEICQDVLRKEPDNLSALRMLAIIATEREQYGVAEGLLRRMVKMAPHHTGALNDLGKFLGDRGRYPEAIEVLEQALELNEQSPAILRSLGDMLAVIGRSADALAAYEKCLALESDDPAALLGRGHMLRIEGRRDDAEASYRSCVEKRPAIGDAWWSLASLHGHRASDADVATMRGRLSSGALVPEAQVAIHFAMARALEQRDDFAAAWEEYRRGNALKRQLIKYDPVETELVQRRIRDTFDASIFEKPLAQTPEDLVPIFVLGMPRSGSTLIEQILASHSAVRGGGELPYVIMISNALAAHRTDGRAYPELVADLDASQLTGLGRSYLHYASTHFPDDSRYITDKMPANYSHVGFIKLMLPHARIIDARRDAMATCVANFRQLFAQGKNQSYDLVELGEYYLQYVEAMEHWDEVLPGQVLRVNYEEVVAGLEAQVRRILDYCGLPFEPGCVDFHKSERPVNTASSEQVRQPIYRDAVEFWRNYEPWLDELKEVLAPVYRDQA